MCEWQSRRSRLLCLVINPWFSPDFERRTRPFPVTLNRFAAVLLVFIFGMRTSYFPLASLDHADRDEPSPFRAPARCGGAGYGETPRDCQDEPATVTRKHRQ